MAQQALVWTETDSSNVSAVAYDTPTKTLCVKFGSGGIYTYKGVANEIYVDLVHAESVGKYLNSVVKPNYPYERFESEADLLHDLAG
jgi:hypothetical protein